MSVNEVRNRFVSANTIKDGSGTEYRLRCNAAGDLIVEATLVGVTGAYNPETDDDSIPPGEERETVNTLLSGFDGTWWERLQTDGSGRLHVADDGVFDIRNITGALSLPTGAATSAIQATMNTSLDEIEDAIENLEEALASVATDYLLIGDAGSIINLDAAGDVQVDILSSVAIAVTAAALPLPAGASTSAIQATMNTSLDEIEDAIENLEEALQSVGTDYLLIGDAGSIINLDANGDVQVDILSSVAIAVTGTFWQVTQPVSLASIPAFNAETDDDNIALGESRETVVALLYGKDTGGNWERINTDGSGNLKVCTP